MRDNNSFYKLNNNQNKETKLPYSFHLEILMNQRITSKKLKPLKNNKNGQTNNRRMNLFGYNKKSLATFLIALLAEGKIDFLM